MSIKSFISDYLFYMNYSDKIYFNIKIELKVIHTEFATNVILSAKA